MNKVKCYLAGKMSGLTWEQMNGWREEATNLFNKKNNNIHLENPCNYYNFEIDPASFSDHECKEFDLWLIKNCDVVLVNLGFSSSIGTAIELELASRFWNKPVIAYGYHDEVHPWMKLSVTKFCNSLEEAIDHILKFYVSNI